MANVKKEVATNDDELFYLKWHNFQKNVSTQFERLREDEDLVDITFACEGKQIRAHKLVLFACSPYFKDLLKTNPCPHPVFFMNDVKHEVMKAILEYMYLGEVHISNDNLKEFIKVAEGLKIRGLTKDKDHLLPGVFNSSVEQIDFDSDASQQSASGNKHPTGTGGAKKMRLNVNSGSLETANEISHKITSANSRIGSQHQSHHVSNVEPKVEMSEFIDGANTRPNYCNMTPLLIDDKNPMNPSAGVNNIPSNIKFDNCPSANDSHQQQQHNIKSDDSSWTSEKHSPHDSTSSEQGKGRSKLNKANCLTPHPCPVCSRLYSNVSNLRQHMRLIHNPTAVGCPICQKNFNSQLYLKRHYSSVHGFTSGQNERDEKPSAQPHSGWNLYENIDSSSTNICH